MSMIVLFLFKNQVIIVFNLQASVPASQGKFINMQKRMIETSFLEVDQNKRVDQ